MSAQSAVIIVQSKGPNILIRVLWFLFIGWYVGMIVSGIAWFLNAIIIGLPLGLYLIDRLPTIITLRPQNQQWRLEGNVLVQGKPQRPFLFRALYFIFIGWWLSGIWMLLAYVAVLTVLGLPRAFWMYGRIAAVTTAYRS